MDFWDSRSDYEEFMAHTEQNTEAIDTIAKQMTAKERTDWVVGMVAE